MVGMRLSLTLLLLVCPFGLKGGAAAASYSLDDNEKKDLYSIVKYIEKGDIEAVSSWFSDNMLIAIMGESTTCSKGQARQIIKSFLKKYTPLSFELLYSSSSYPIHYLVCRMKSNGAIFSFTYTLQNRDSNCYVEQIRIDKE